MNKPLIIVLLLVVILTAACYSNRETAESSETGNKQSEVSDQNNETEPQPAETPAPKTVTVTYADGTEEEVPYQISSLNQLLEQNIDTGVWTEAEGIKSLLQYITGEITAEEIPNAAYVVGRGGTTIVRRANLYLAREDRDDQYAAEIERLLGIIFPSQETLDQISKPAVELSKQPSGGLASPLLQDADSCQDLARSGFAMAEFEGNTHCYDYIEAQTADHRLRVYYPRLWLELEGDGRKLVEGTLEAMQDSTAVFTTLGDFGDVNLVFSLSKYSEDEPEKNKIAAAVAYDVDQGETCPTTFFQPSMPRDLSDIQQIVAHELFHCFQYWNYNTYSNTSDWWMEGSADFFSNVVYPENDLEHEYLDIFNQKSITKSLLEMEYANYLFFQFVSNYHGAKEPPDGSEVIMLLITLSNGNGTAESLAGYPEIDKIFHEFVVALMSKKIRDSSSDLITMYKPTITDLELIDDTENDETFSAKPFVASRYMLLYDQEKRFFQSTEKIREGKHSAVKKSESENLAAWSSIPPEIRSLCESFTPYYLVVTTTNPGEEFTQIINLEKVEEADCDPCLLGAWEIDNESYAAYIKSISESQAGNSGLPQGTDFKVEISGKNYVDFTEDSTILTRRDKFMIAIGASGYPAVETVFDSQGTAFYSADGEELIVKDVLETVNSQKTSFDVLDVLPFGINQTQDSTTYNIFGGELNGPELSEGENPPDAAGSYTCTQDTLILDLAEQGEVQFNRTEEILPTPVPTPGSEEGEAEGE